MSEKHIFSQSFSVSRLAYTWMFLPSEHPLGIHPFMGSNKTRSGLVPLQRKDTGIPKHPKETNSFLPIFQIVLIDIVLSAQDVGNNWQHSHQLL